MDMNKEYASKSVAGTGLGMGIAGTAMGILNSIGGMDGLANLFGNRSTAQNDVLTALLTADMIRGRSGGDCDPVTQREMKYIQQIAEKDTQISLRDADKYTDQKLTEVTTYLMGQIKDLAGEVRKNKDEQTGVNMQQVAYNATNTATIGCIQSQVAALQGMTKLVVPNSSVCPGWGTVKITPDTTATPAT